MGLRNGVRASIFEYQVICFDGGDVPHIFDVQARLGTPPQPRKFSVLTALFIFRNAKRITGE
jgi:hypothetical protein